MRRFAFALLVAALVAPPTASAQMTYRLRGVVRDDTNKPVPGVKVRAEALVGFRGEQFVGAKEFEVTTNDKGEWVILGLTSGIWSFEATSPDVIPQVVLLPVNFTNRKPQSAHGGALAWDLPLWVRRPSHEGLKHAAALAMAGKKDEAVAAIGTLAVDPDANVLCAAGELALLVEQNGLARAIFQQVLQREARHACGTLGLASSAMMQNDLDAASKMLWAAIELVPREQKEALGHAVKDLAQITGTKN